MNERQMTIDDYLNNDNVELKDLNKKETAERIEAEAVNYNDLTKEELVNILIDKDKVLKLYEDKYNETVESHKAELNNMNEFYSKRVEELTHIINYYERKLKVVKDILNLETGGEK